MRRASYRTQRLSVARSADVESRERLGRVRSVGEPLRADLRAMMDDEFPRWRP